LKPEGTDTFGESSSEATAENPYGYNYSATGASSWAHSSQYEPNQANHAVGGITGPYPVTKKKKKRKDKEAKTPKQLQAAALGVGTIGSWKERQQTPKSAPVPAPTSPKRLTETTMSPFRQSLMMQDEGTSNKFAMSEMRSFDDAKKAVTPKARQGSFLSTNTSTPRAESSVPTSPRSSLVNKRVSVDKPLLEVTRPVAASQKRNPGYPTG
jgi:hypothetical protein